MMEPTASTGPLLQESRGSPEPETLRRALAETGLVVSRGAALDEAAHLALASALGEVLREPPHSSMRTHPGIAAFANDAARGFVSVGGFWHADGIFRHRPARFSLVVTRHAPDEGARTRFCDTAQLYQALTPEERRIADGLWIQYRDGVRHPLVCLGAAGQPAIYASPELAIGILRPEGSAPASTLLRAIEHKFDDPKHARVVSSQPGDLVVWDNHRVSHRAVKPTQSGLRLIHRVTTIEDPPPWIAQGSRSPPPGYCFEPYR
jgi:taurine dioxygenase